MWHWPGGKQMPFTQQSAEHAVQPPHWPAGRHEPSEQQPPPGHTTGAVTHAPVLGLHESVVHSSKSLQTFTPRVQRWVVRLQLSEVQAEVSAHWLLLVQHSWMAVKAQRPALQVSVVQGFWSLQSPALAQQLTILVFLHSPPGSQVSVVQAM